MTANGNWNAKCWRGAVLLQFVVSLPPSTRSLFNFFTSSKRSISLNLVIYLLENHQPCQTLAKHKRLPLKMVEHTLTSSYFLDEILLVDGRRTRLFAFLTQEATLMKLALSRSFFSESGSLRERMEVPSHPNHALDSQMRNQSPITVNHSRR